MGFLSSLFDFGDKPSTTSSTVVPQYPEELKPNIQEIVDASKTIYDQRLAEGYQPYTGQTIAGFTPEEVASQEGLKSLVGTQGPLQQEALDIARGTDRQFTPEVAQQYMSPYLRTALDAQKAEAQRQYERSKRPQFEAQAVAAGGMSGLGTRAAVESAEREVGQQRLLANIEAAGQQKAFESAQDAFKDQTARERQAAAQISTAAPNIFKSGIAEQGLLQTMGEQKRDLAQSTLDEAYLKYVEQQQFPEQQLARYQSSIYGNPLLKQPSYNTTGTTTGGGPGLGKTLLGLGTTALGFGTGGGNSIGGSLFKSLIPSAGGGGIASTMKAQPYVQYMNREMGGQVMPPVVYRKKGSIGVDEINRLAALESLRDKNYIPTRDDERNIEYSSDEQIKKLMKTPYRDFKKQSDAIAGLDAPQYKDKKFTPFFGSPRDVPLLEYQQTALDEKRARGLTATELADTSGDESVRQQNQLGLTSITDDERSAAQKKRRNEPLSILNVSKSKPGDAGADPDETETPLRSTVGTETGGGVLGLQDLIKPKDARKETVAATKKEAENNVLSAMEIRGIEKETANDVKGLLSSFSDKYKKLAKDDPYKMQKFWFTVGSNIMKKGNAFANMAEGLKIAVDDLDGTRKEKNKLLMELEDTLTKANVKLTEKEGTSKVNLEKLNNKQKNLLAKLGPIGTEAFNKQVKANQSFMAALTAARKAETAAQTEARKNRDENKLKVKDLQGIRSSVNDMLLTLGGAFGRIGKAPLGKKELNIQNTLVTNATAIANGEMMFDGKTGPAAVPAYLAKAARDLDKK